MGKLIIDGNSVYEIDEECIREKEKKTIVHKVSSEVEDEVRVRNMMQKEKVLTFE